jgi:hypothetical protein
MNLLLRCIIGAYSRTLNLYPHRFKDEFAIEMHIVFSNSVRDAGEEGILPLVLICGREFMGMPFSILKEFWHEIQGEEANMQGTQFAPWEPGSWGDSVWAGLPHLLIAILFAVTGTLVNTRLATISGIVIALVLLGCFLATIYYTWRNRWPAWSASWYGYLGLIILLFTILPYQYWVGLADQIFEGIRFILLLLCLATLLYWLSRRNPIEGLLMAMPLIILYWFPVMEFIPNSIRFWLTLWLFLLPALTATAITRLNDIKKAIWMVLGASILSGLPIAYARTYWNNVPAEYSSAPTLGQMTELFSVPWLASGALVLAPILGWGLWNLGRKYGRVGRVSAILMILGMVINLFGHFSYWWSFSHQAYLNALQISAIYRPNEASSLSMVYGGFALTLLGAIALVILSWKQNKLLSIPLILAPLALPLVAMFPTYFGYYIVPAGFSFEFGRLAEIYRYLILLIGAAWLVMSGWTITRLYGQPLHERIA